MNEELDIYQLKKKDKLKNIVIALFVIEQFVIMFVIIARKGECLIDWFSDLL